jgi:ribosomal protein S18 acetylase RimI-like enzyme
MSLKWINGTKLGFEELHRIARIDNSIPAKFDPTWFTDEAALKERTEAFQKLSDADFFEVIYDDSEVVGFHVLRGKPPVAHIWTLWVHSDYRRRGLAKKLKERGLEWAKLNGFSYIQTSVNKENKRMHEINLENGYEPYSTVYRLKL